MTVISKLIKQELLQAKATKSELADFVEVPEEKIIEILDGLRKPTVEESIKIAQFFDLDLMLFIGGK